MYNMVVQLATSSHSIVSVTQYMHFQVEIDREGFCDYQQQNFYMQIMLKYHILKKKVHIISVLEISQSKRNSAEGPRSRHRTLSVLQKLPRLSVKSPFHVLYNHCLRFCHFRLSLPDLFIFCIFKILLMCLHVVK